jgi:hypothetical protein
MPTPFCVAARVVDHDAVDPDGVGVERDATSS